MWIGALTWTDTGQLISGDRNGHVVVWTRTGERMAEADARGSVISLDFAKKGNRFVLFSLSDGRVGIFALGWPCPPGRHLSWRRLAMASGWP